MEHDRPMTAGGFLAACGFRVLSYDSWFCAASVGEALPDPVPFRYRP